MLTKFIQSAAADSPVGGIGGRGEGNGGDLSLAMEKAMHPRGFVADAPQFHPMTLQLPAKQILWAVLAISPGKDQGIDGGMQGNLGKDIT